MTDLPAFRVAEFLTELRRVGCTLGEPFQYFAQIGSTNDEALAAARQGAPSGALFLADLQTQGRGRRGREWLAPSGAGLWFTVIYRSRQPLALAAPLTLVVGVALREALADSLGLPFQLKWPNDVEIERKKVAGILLETETVSDASGRSLQPFAIGIGLNTHLDLPPEVLPYATSLHALGNAPPRERLLVHILRQLAVWLQRFERNGAAAIVSELQKHDALLGEPVRVDDTRGVGAGIDSAGRLLIDTGAGRVAVAAGSVERER